MKSILLDECLPVKLKYRFEELDEEFTVSTVTEKGWTAIKNGELLKLAQNQFEIFITVDKNLPFQQNLQKYNIAVVVLKSKSIRYKDLLGYVLPSFSVIRTAEVGKVSEVKLLSN